MKGFKVQELMAYESNSKDGSVTTAEWMKGVTVKQNKELGKRKEIKVNESNSSKLSNSLAGEKIVFSTNGDGKTGHPHTQIWIFT